jgi:hypothetical protein
MTGRWRSDVAPARTLEALFTSHHNSGEVFRSATATDDAVVRLVEVAGSFKLGAWDAGESVEDQAVTDYIEQPVDYE